MSYTFGNQRTRFTPKMWERWLARFNEAPSPELQAGIREMRDLLQARCLGKIHQDAGDTGAYRAFVTRQFGSVK